MDTMVGHMQSLAMAVTPIGVSIPKQHVVDVREEVNSEAEGVSVPPRAQPPLSPSPALRAPAFPSLACSCGYASGPTARKAPSRGRGFSSASTVVGVPASGSALLMSAPTRSRRETRSWGSSLKDGRLWGAFGSFLPCSALASSLERLSALESTSFYDRAG